MARLRPVSEQFKIAREGTLEQIQKTIVRVAKTENARIMATDPRPSSFTRTVDGKVGALEEAVKPDGVIIYVYQRLDEVVAFALETLQKLSPVHSGRYRAGHIILVNGHSVEEMPSLKPSDDVAISNVVPYARKIEMGMMTMLVSGTDHVYQQAEQIVNARFGNLVKTRFTYRNLSGGDTHLERWAQTRGALAHAKRHGRVSDAAQWLRRQPALTFSVR